MGCYNKFGEYDCRQPYPDRHRRHRFEEFGPRRFEEFGPRRFEEFGPRRFHGPCGSKPCYDHRPFPPWPFF